MQILVHRLLAWEGTSDVQIRAPRIQIQIQIHPLSWIQIQIHPHFSWIQIQIHLVRIQIRIWIQPYLYIIPTFSRFVIGTKNLNPDLNPDPNPPSFSWIQIRIQVFKVWIQIQIQLKKPWIRI